MTGATNADGRAIGGGQVFYNARSQAQQTSPATYDLPPETLTSSGVLNGLPTFATASYSGVLKNGDTHVTAAAQVGANNVEALGDSNFFLEAGLSFQDTIGFTSSSLPYGTPVQYILTDNLAMALTSTNAGGPSGPFCNSIVNVFSSGSFGDNHISACGGDQESASTLQIQGTSYVGSDSIIVVASGVQVYTDSSLNYLQGSGTVDSDVSLSILTPGVTYTSGDGFTYTPVAVPEPGLVWLVLFGTVILFGCSRVPKPSIELD